MQDSARRADLLERTVQVENDNRIDPCVTIGLEIEVGYDQIEVSLEQYRDRILQNEDDLGVNVDMFELDDLAWEFTTTPGDAAIAAKTVEMLYEGGYLVEDGRYPLHVNIGGLRFDSQEQQSQIYLLSRALEASALTCDFDRLCEPMVLDNSWGGHGVRAGIRSMKKVESDDPIASGVEFRTFILKNKNEAIDFMSAVEVLSTLLKSNQEAKMWKRGPEAEISEVMKLRSDLWEIFSERSMSLFNRYIHLDPSKEWTVPEYGNPVKFSEFTQFAHYLKGYEKAEPGSIGAEFVAQMRDLIQDTIAAYITINHTHER